MTPDGHAPAVVAPTPSGSFPSERDRGFVVARRLALARSSGPRDLASKVARHPWDLVTAARYVAGLPRIEARVTATDVGEWVRHRLVSGRRVASVGLARAVLEIPDTEEAYLQGRRKQALRTNVRRAREAGSTVDLAEDDGREFTEREITSHRLARLGARQLGPAGQMVVVVSGPDGEVQATAALAVDAEWAHLERLRHHGARDGALMARYLLHLHVVRALRERGVRYLHAGTTLGAKHSVGYFQYLTGYEAINIVMPVRRPS